MFALLVYWIHSYLGLVGLVYFIALTGMLLAYLGYRLIRPAGLPIQAEVVLVGMALATLKSLMTPRPWLLTMVFFAVELAIIYRARASENGKSLWYLPLLFCVWANVHIQFVYGLAVLGLLFGEALLAYWANPRGWRLAVPALSLRTIALVSLASVAATFATPYHFLLYEQVFAYMFAQSGVFQLVSEVHPMFFRSFGDWLVLALTLWSTYTLGWYRNRSHFRSYYC